MHTTNALDAAVAAHRALLKAQASRIEATTARDAAVIEARGSGASAIEIADALALSRQQVHKILDKKAINNGTLRALRAELITGGARYEDLLEDDQWFVDCAVAEAAKERGLSLD